MWLSQKENPTLWKPNTFFSVIRFVPRFLFCETSLRKNKELEFRTLTNVLLSFFLFHFPSFHFRAFTHFIFTKTKRIHVSNNQKKKSRFSVCCNRSAAGSGLCHQVFFFLDFFNCSGFFFLCENPSFFFAVLRSSSQAFHTQLAYSYRNTEKWPFRKKSMQTSNKQGEPENICTQTTCEEDTQSWHQRKVTAWKTNKNIFFFAWKGQIHTKDLLSLPTHFPPLHQCAFLLFSFFLLLFHIHIRIISLAFVIFFFFPKKKQPYTRKKEKKMNRLKLSKATVPWIPPFLFLPNSNVACGVNQ